MRDNVMREFETENFIVRASAEEEFDLDLSWDDDGFGTHTPQFTIGYTNQRSGCPVRDHPAERVYKSAWHALILIVSPTLQLLVTKGANMEDEKDNKEYGGEPTFPEDEAIFDSEPRKDWARAKGLCPCHGMRNCQLYEN